MGKKFKNVFLHFGADKTGSTSIQVALGRARARLLASGTLAYPPGDSHWQIGSYMSSRPERYIHNVLSGNNDPDELRAADAEAFKALNRWLEEAPDCRSLVLSYEGFGDLDEAGLLRLKNYAERWAETVTVIFYVRDPLDYAPSAMSQRVKSGRPAWPAGGPPVADYRATLEKIRWVFGKDRLRVRAFARAAMKNGNVLDDFLEVIGLSGQVLAQDIADAGERRNASLSSTALRFGEALIAHFGRLGLRRRNARFMERYGRFLNVIPGPRIRLTQAQAEEIRTVSLPQLHYLEQEYGIVFEGRAESGDTAEKEPDGLDEFIAAAAEVVAHAIGHAHREVRPNFAASDFMLLHARMNGTNSVGHGGAVDVEVGFSLGSAVNELEIGIDLIDEVNRCAFATTTTQLQARLHGVGEGTHRVVWRLIANLPDGEYSVGLSFRALEPQGGRDLAHYRSLVRFQVSVPRLAGETGYTSLPVAFEHLHTGEVAAGPVADTAGSLSAEAPLSEITLVDSVELPVRLTNSSERTWFNTRFNPIHLSYRWLDVQGNVVVPEGRRTPIEFRELPPGESVTVQMHVAPPPRTGRYRLVLLPVQELRFWFDSKNFQRQEIDVTVLEVPERRFGKLRTQ